MKLDASAPKRMTANDRLLVRMAQPENYKVTVAYAEGWGVTIRDGRTIVGQSEHFYTFGGAFAAALAASKVPA